MWKGFRLMNIAQIKAKFAKIEEDNSWDELFYRIQVRTEEQERELGLSYEIATSFENAEKNRYRNVLPYDQNRVTLKKVDNFKSNYINASPLKFPGSERGYILSQGPLPNTTDDFWQMVYEQNVEVVIMLSKIMEKNFIKCHSYFPSKDNPTERYEVTECELLSEEVKSHYVLRRIRVTLYDPPPKKSISKLEDAAYNLAEKIGLKTPSAGVDKSRTEGVIGASTVNKSRIIYHFQYMTWPDFGVPEHTDHFLEFLQHIRDLEKRLHMEKETGTDTTITSNFQSEELEQPKKLVDMNEIPEFNKSQEPISKQPVSFNNLAKDVGENDLNVVSCENVKKTRNRSAERPPIVCHCSAGIGRTGAFVMIDTMLSVLEQKLAKPTTLPPLATSEEDLDLANEIQEVEKTKIEIFNIAQNMSESNAVMESIATPSSSDKADEDLRESQELEQPEQPAKSVEPPVATSCTEKTKKEKEEEEFNVATKKKMRSEDVHKPLMCGKIICPSTARERQQIFAKMNKTGSISESGDNAYDNEHIELETLCDVVVFMRKYRMGLIQTPQQLRFCWKAIVDWIEKNGNSSEK